jgi:hypothetical protein
MQHLTFLEVRSMSIENLLELSILTNLYELHLHVGGDIAIGPSTVPDLAFPPSLKVLELLSPVEAGILCLVPTGLQQLSIKCGVEGPVEGPDSLLSSLPALQHLTRLSILPEPISALKWPPAGPAYSALTTSSNLVHLALTDITCPEGIWPHVFPAARKLPHLTAFSMHAICMPDCPVLCPTWGAADLSSLVSCCPGLCDIEALSVQPGAHVSELRKLTALTHLLIDFKGPDSFDESVRGLAGLDQLHFLELVQVSPTFKVASLLPLTSLTALRQLEVDWQLEDQEHSELELRFSTTQVMTSQNVTVATAALEMPQIALTAGCGWCLLPA